MDTNINNLNIIYKLVIENVKYNFNKYKILKQYMNVHHAFFLIYLFGIMNLIIKVR